MALSFDEYMNLPHNDFKIEIENRSRPFDVVSRFPRNPFFGNLSTPITTSKLTKAYMRRLPAYKAGSTPFLRGVNIGYIHGYFLLGPFVELGPLRDSAVATFIGFLATIGLILILTLGLVLYGIVTFDEQTKEEPTVDFLTSEGWRRFTSGFILGGCGGAGIGYFILKLVGSGFNISI